MGRLGSATGHGISLPWEGHGNVLQGTAIADPFTIRRSVPRMYFEVLEAASDLTNSGVTGASISAEALLAATVADGAEVFTAAMAAEATLAAADLTESGLLGAAMSAEVLSAATVADGAEVFSAAFTAEAVMSATVADGAEIFSAAMTMEAVLAGNAADFDLLTQVSNCKLWLRAEAANVSTVAGLVQRWIDGSGEGNDVLQGTSTMRPTWTSSDANYNGQAVLTFDGGDWLRAGAFAANVAQPWTMYTIASTTGATQVVLDDGGAGGFDGIYFASAVWKASAGSIIASAVGTQGNARAHCFIGAGASSYYYTNDFTTEAVTGNAGAGAVTSLTVGASNAGAGQVSGVIAEVIIFSGAHDQTTRNIIRDYLNAYYGTSIT